MVDSPLRMNTFAPVELPKPRPKVASSTQRAESSEKENKAEATEGAADPFGAVGEDGWQQVQKKKKGKGHKRKEEEKKSRNNATSCEVVMARRAHSGGKRNNESAGQWARHAPCWAPLAEHELVWFPLRNRYNDELVSLPSP